LGTKQGIGLTAHPQIIFDREAKFVNQKKFNPLLVLALLMVFGVSLTATQPADAGQRKQAAPDAFTFLPQSDGVLVVDVRRLMNETLPQVLATNTEKLTQINADIDQFKAKTGVDPRAFDRLVVGTRFTHPRPNVTKLEPVAIAQGKFDVKALADAGREAAKGNVREEKYRGATIMRFGVYEQVKLFGLWNLKVHELSVCALNSTTLAIGSLESVRAAIDAGRTRRRSNADLIALATRDPQAVIGFGANLSRDLMANFDLGTDAIAQDVNAIRQVYGSIGSTNTDVSFAVVARTDTPVSAKNLGDTVTGLRQLAGFFVMRLKADKQALAQSALDNLKITTRGNELEIRTQFAAANLASVIK
jgi:hypothetical protein